MEEEIDLRPYLLALFSYRYWIIVATVFTGLVAYIVSANLPPVYEATALIIVTSPRQVVLNSLTQSIVDPNLVSVEEAVPLLSTYPELAVSDEMMRQLSAELTVPVDKMMEMEDLRKLLIAEAGSDPGLIRLTVEHQDAETAAYIVNMWAKIFVAWINETYGVATSERLAFFEMQLANAHMNLESAEEELIAYQGSNRAAVLQSRLDALSKTLAELLAEQRVITFLKRDAERLQTQLTTAADGGESLPAYELTALSLQLRAYNAQALTSLELQLEAATTLTGADLNAQLNFLDGLMSSLAEQQTYNETMLTAVEPQILVLQQERQEVLTELLRLQRVEQEAQESYTALARRVDTERISAEDTTGGASLASSSDIPRRPLRPRVIINAAIAMFIGMILSSMAVLYRELVDAP